MSEIGSCGQRGCFLRGCGRREARDLGDGKPVVFVAVMHMARAGPDRDLRAGSDAGILLHKSGRRNVQFRAE